MKKSVKSSSRIVAVALLSVLMLTISVWMSCQREMPTTVQPGTQEGVQVLSKKNPQIQAVMAVQDRHTPDLMIHPDVVGTATGLTAEGKLRNCLFSTDERDARHLLRSGGSDDQLADLVREAVLAKKQMHGSESGRFSRTDRTMHQIGG